MTADTAAVAVSATLDTAAVIAIAFIRIWPRRPPRRPARDLRRLLADVEADEFDAIIRAVTDDHGNAL